jgi:hypothetical protein
VLVHGRAVAQAPVGVAEAQLILSARAPTSGRAARGHAAERAAMVAPTKLKCTRHHNSMVIWNF